MMVPGVPLVEGLAFALLLGGLLCATHPLAPGGFVSLTGVYLYWWATGLGEPATLTLAMLTALGTLALLGQAVAHTLARRIGASSSVVPTIAAAVGFGAFLFMGTSGFVVGMLLTAFLLELLRRRDYRQGFVAALVIVVAAFGLRLFQLLLTGAILAVMLDVALAGVNF
jgi:uncharacterized protein YqgC (DUF456 family)